MLTKIVKNATPTCMYRCEKLFFFLFLPLDASKHGGKSCPGFLVCWVCRAGSENKVKLITSVSKVTISQQNFPFFFLVNTEHIIASYMSHKYKRVQPGLKDVTITVKLFVQIQTNKYSLQN